MGKLKEHLEEHGRISKDQENKYPIENSKCIKFLFNLGRSSLHTTNLALGIDCFKKAYEMQKNVIKREKENKSNIVQIKSYLNIIHYLTRTLYDAGKGTSEIKIYTKEALNYVSSLDQKIKLQVQEEIVNIYVDIARVYVDLNKIAKSREYYNKSLEITKKMEDMRKSVPVLNGLGALCAKEKGEDWKENLKKAIEYYKEAIAQYTVQDNKKEDKEWKGRIHYNLSCAYLNLYRIDPNNTHIQKAINSAKKSLEYYTELYGEKFHHRKARTFNNLGNAIAKTQDNKIQAIESYNQAIRNYKKTYDGKEFIHADLARTYKNLGQIENGKKNYRLGYKVMEAKLNRVKARDKLTKSELELFEKLKALIDNEDKDINDTLYQSPKLV